MLLSSWIVSAACWVLAASPATPAEWGTVGPRDSARIQSSKFRVIRLPRNPIITPQMLPGEDGSNINGPSLIRVPPWVKKPLGKYYLYFGHHRGRYIRMAYANAVEGPYTIHPGGVLHLADQRVFHRHIASPDVIVDERNQEILLYYHGVVPKEAKHPGFEEHPGQATSVAVSKDGIHYTPLNVIVAPAYLRMFRYKGCWYGLTGSGRVFRARDLKAPFENGHDVIDKAQAVQALHPQGEGKDSATTKPWSGRVAFRFRHAAIDLNGDELTFYFTCIGHRPERILRTRCTLGDDWTTWKAAPSFEDVLRPERPWEGANLPLEFSQGGLSRKPENALRDPGIFKEAGKTYLLYSVMGEYGIAIGRLE